MTATGRCQVLTAEGPCVAVATARFAGTPMCAYHDGRFRDPDGRVHLQALADVGTEWAAECEEFGCHDATP